MRAAAASDGNYGFDVTVNDHPGWWTWKPPFRQILWGQLLQCR